MRRSTTSASPVRNERAPDASPRVSRGVHIIVQVLAALITLFFLGRLANVTYRQLLYPYDLLFESPGLATIDVIRAGMNPYAPSTYAQPPFVITLYTPLYHYLVAALPQWPANPWFTGRLVTLICTVLAAAMLIVIGYRRVPWLVSLAAFAIYFAFWPVSPNSVFLKNDMLALALGATAVVLLDRAPRRWWAAALAGVLGVLALAAKQAYGAPMLACLTYLVIAHRRILGWFLLGAACAATGFLSMIVLVWGSGFWFSTIGALHQAMSLSWGLAQILRLLQQPLSWGVAVLAVALLIQRWRDVSAGRLIQSPYLTYVACTLLLVALTIWKTGSGSNYFVELLLAALMWIVDSLGAIRFPDGARRLTWAALVVLVVCCAAEPLIARHRDYTFADDQQTAVAMRYYPLMRQTVLELGLRHPLILNPSTHRHTYAIGGRMALNDPLQYLMMWSDNILSQEPFLQSIDARAYDLIMLPHAWLDAPVLPPVEYRIVAAILHAYRPARDELGWVYFVRP